MSLYGSQLWPLWNNDFLNKICRKWRNALRRIWNLPADTHCDLLPLITSQVPIDIQIKCRYFKFYKALINSEMILFLIYLKR